MERIYKHVLTTSLILSIVGALPAPLPQSGGLVPVLGAPAASNPIATVPVVKSPLAAAGGGLLGNLGLPGAGVLSGGGDVADGLASGLGNTVGGLTSGFGGTVTDLTGALSDLLGDGTSGLGDIAGGTLSGLGGVLEGGLNDVGGTLDSSIGGTDGVLGGATNQLDDLLFDGPTTGNSPTIGTDDLPDIGNVILGAGELPTADVTDPLPRILDPVLSGVGNIVDPILGVVTGPGTVPIAPVIPTGTSGLGFGLSGDVGVDGTVNLPPLDSILDPVLGAGDVVDPLLNNNLPGAGLPSLSSVGDVLGVGGLPNVGNIGPLDSILDPVLGAGDVVDPLLNNNLPGTGLPSLPSVGATDIVTDILEPALSGVGSLEPVLHGIGDVVEPILGSASGTGTVPTATAPTTISIPSIGLGIGGDVEGSGAVILPSSTVPSIGLGASADAGVEATVPGVDIPVVLPTSLANFGLILDPVTGFLHDPVSGLYFSVRTGLALQIDPLTGFPIEPTSGFPINPTPGLSVLPTLPSPPVILPSSTVINPTLPSPLVDLFTNILDDLRQKLIAKLFQSSMTHGDATKLLSAIPNIDRGEIFQTMNHYFADANSLLSAENTLLLGWKRPASKKSPKVDLA
ncbi:hypothetical protein N0V95_003521 [Ascochyta clinopodiicola]|nr:hypothetical protein N0V95_003521 [Ascochyta clinopodiicola]